MNDFIIKSPHIRCTNEILPKIRMNVMKMFGRQKNRRSDSRSKVPSELSSPTGQRKTKIPSAQLPPPRSSDEPPESKPGPNRPKISDKTGERHIPRPTEPELTLHSPETTTTSVPTTEKGYGATTPASTSGIESTASVTTTTPATEAPELAEAKPEDQLNKGREEALLRAWMTPAKPTKLPIPTNYPDYMRGKPKLSYFETDTFLLRREYNKNKMKRYDYQSEFKKHSPLMEGPTPRENTTSILRRTFVRKQPIMSDYFEKHYSTYNRPPFRNICLKLDD